MIKKLIINKFENNIIDNFLFNNNELNYINIKSFENSYVYYNEELKKLFNLVINESNTIIFIDDKEILNLISNITYCNKNKIFTESNNKKFTEIKTKKGFYKLNIKNYNELKSLEEYCNLHLKEDDVIIYTTIKIKNK